MIKFQTIGTGVHHITTTGRKSIRIDFDVSQLFNVPEDALRGGVFAFPNERKKDANEPDFTLMAKVDSSGETERKLRDMHQTERSLYFAEWLFSSEGQRMIDDLVRSRIDLSTSQPKEFV